MGPQRKKRKEEKKKIRELIHGTDNKVRKLRKRFLKRNVEATMMDRNRVNRSKAFVEENYRIKRKFKREFLQFASEQLKKRKNGVKKTDLKSKLKTEAS